MNENENENPEKSQQADGLDTLKAKLVNLSKNKV